MTKREPRLLVVGAYRILTLKGGKGRAIAREGHLLQLKKLSSDSPVHAKLEFSDFVFEVRRCLVPPCLLPLSSVGVWLLRESVGKRA